MSDQQKIILWGKKVCPYCDQVRAFLKANNYEYETIDVEGHDILRDVLEAKYNARRVPVIEVGGNGKFEAVLGPDLIRLAEVLGLAK
jgi:glutaredoxin 3